MTGKLVLENLKHRPMRSLLSILLIGVPVTLILCLVGLSHGFIEDSQKRARGVGADIMIRPKSSSILSLGYTMPIELVDYFRKQPHVKIATGVFNVTVEGVTLGASGVDLKEFDAMSGGFTFKSGGPFQGPDDAIIDEYYADQKKYHTGSRIRMLNHDWRVSGIMESGKLSHIVLPLDSLQAKTGNIGKVSQIYLKLDDPANTRATVDYLEKLPAAGRLSDLCAGRLHLRTQREQHSRAQGIHHRDHGHRRGDRIRGGLPFDVHVGVAAHAGDRHPQEPGRIERIHPGDHHDARLSCSESAGRFSASS